MAGKSAQALNPTPARDCDLGTPPYTATASKLGHVAAAATRDFPYGPDF